MALRSFPRCQGEADRGSANCSIAAIKAMSVFADRGPIADIPFPTHSGHTGNNFLASLPAVDSQAEHSYSNYPPN